MSHSLTKIWIHGIFGTKDRKSLIKQFFEKQLHTHIKEKLENELECKPRIINGTENHLHLLFMLNPNSPLKDIFKYIKGESSHWIDENIFVNSNFRWQSGYGAFSIRESMVEEV